MSHLAIPCFDTVVDFEGPTTHSRHDIHGLYVTLRKSQDDLAINATQEEVKKTSLRPLLRDYQLQAVQWMLNRERRNGKGTFKDMFSRSSLELCEDLAPQWELISVTRPKPWL